MISSPFVGTELSGVRFARNSLKPKTIMAEVTGVVFIAELSMSVGVRRFRSLTKNKMITILYTCPACNVVDVPLQVPAREDSDKNSVVPWVKRCAFFVGQHHHSTHPKCDYGKCDLKIPIQEGQEFIGQQVE